MIYDFSPEKAGTFYHIALGLIWICRFSNWRRIAGHKNLLRSQPIIFRKVFLVQDVETSSSGAAFLSDQDLLRRRLNERKHLSPPIFDQAAFDKIIASIETQRFAIFVGAGLSVPAGLPSWGALLSNLADDLVPAEHRVALDLLYETDGPLAFTRYAKSRTGLENYFPSHVAHALYNHEIDYKKQNPTLELIVYLLRSAQLFGKSLDIICYNFDDLLETALIDQGIQEFRSVSTQKDYSKRDNYHRILHVHGYLPRQRPPTGYVGPIILSEDEFHDLMSAENDWRNECQIESLKEGDCLFLGLSMADPNLRRLLDYSKVAPKSIERLRFAISKAYIVGDLFGPRKLTIDSPTADVLNQIKFELLYDIGAEIHYIFDYNQISAFIPTSPRFGL